MGQSLLSHLAVVQGVFDAADDSSSKGDARARLNSVLETVKLWISVLPAPESLPLVDEERSSDVSSSSIQRCLAREVVRGAQILSKVRHDMLIVR